MNNFAIVLCAFVAGTCSFIANAASADDEILLRALMAANRARVNLQQGLAERQKRHAENANQLFVNLQRGLIHNREKRSFIQDDLANRGTMSPSTTTTTPSSPPPPTTPFAPSTTPTTTTTKKPKPPQINIKFPIPTLPETPIFPKFPKFPTFPSFPWGRRPRWL